ncbi:TPA: hypothetical protein JBE46_01000 [Legionella pneumophila subsp. pneumophila]|nr:hypothetical protein D7214_08015 [Legionella pneumophila]HAT8681915.1 hypothetical protein [Legionella pneumophila subsp. pneumophila ATCC 43283]HAT8841879.1 hypothetical protein [Legionella pneumophila subsp. pneumophila]TIE30400.1 hypothetical protein DIZ48_00090 [Legionella pneumophila]TIE51765.1 hypothetical protein DIZ50_00090 [Legionella pneumophila]
MYLSPLIFHNGDISMLRKIGFTLLCAVATFSSSTYSSVTHTLQAGVTLEYEFPPNEPLVFVNYLYWEVAADCKITSEDPSNELFAEALAKAGKINGVTLSKGNTMKVTVHSGDILKLSAESGAKVQITNFGPHTLKATCTA